MLLTFLLHCCGSTLQVEAGDRFTCILSQQGAPYCFGDGSYGQLGTGSFASSSVPLLISNPAPAPPSPPASPPPPPSPPPPSPPIIVNESSSAPVGAIVGSVVGGVAGECSAVQGCEALYWFGCKLGVGVFLGVLLCVCRRCLMHPAAPTCLLTQPPAACPILHSPPTAIAAAAAGLLWLRRRRRRAAAGALPHGTSKGVLHSSSGGGKGGGRGDAAVEELHIMQQKGLAASHHASGSSIPAGWRCELGCVGVSIFYVAG